MFSRHKGCAQFCPSINTQNHSRLLPLGLCDDRCCVSKNKNHKSDKKKKEKAHKEGWSYIFHEPQVVLVLFPGVSWVQKPQRVCNPPPIFYPQPLTIYLRLPQKPLNRYPKTTICLAERLMGIAQQGHYSNTSWVWGWRGSAVADCIGHLSCPVYTVSQVIPPQPQELSRL